MIVRSKPLGQIISESARGEHDAWLIDLAHPTVGSHEERFNRFTIAQEMAPKFPLGQPMRFARL